MFLYFALHVPSFFQIYFSKSKFFAGAKRSDTLHALENQIEVRITLYSYNHESFVLKYNARVNCIALFIVGKSVLRVNIIQGTCD